MTTKLELFSPAAALIQGRNARQQYDAGQTRNALAQMELDNAPREIESRNALMDMQRQAQQQALSKEQAQFAYARLRQAADSGNPKAFILQHIPDLASKLGQQGIDLQSMDDQSAAQLVDNLARKYAGDAGVLPQTPQETLELQQTEGPYGSKVLTYGNTMRVVEQPQAPKPEAPKDERLVQIADEQGNPKWVRESDAVGQRAYTPRDKPVADLKYQRELRSKWPRLQAAKRRVERLTGAVNSIAKNVAFDGGPVDQYALAWTKQGQEVAQAKAALTSELTALTRVPGIGSQSDLETRLASLPFPSAEFAPEVNARAVAELQAFMNDLEDVYGGALESGESAQSPGAAPSQAPAQQAPAQAPAAAIEYLRQNPQFKGAFRQKYGYLPPGM